MSTRVVGLLLLALATVGWSQPAAADELPAETRMHAEHIVLDGRLQDLPTALRRARSERDRFPLELSRWWWRRSAGTVPEALRLPPGEPPHAQTGGGEPPYPLLDVLIADRVRRETLGAHGLPEEGRLAAWLATYPEGRTAEEAWVLRFAMAMQVRSYRGDEDPAYAAQADRKAAGHANLNQLVYLACLGALIVGSFFGALIVARDRRQRTDT